MRRAGVAGVVALATAVVLSGCGGDDEGAAGDGRGDEIVTDDSRRTDDVTVDATATADRGTVVIDFTVTNDGDVPVAVVDPTSRPDHEVPVADGVVQISFLAPVGGSRGGEPLPPGEGVLLAPGESHSGTTRALTRDAEVPDAVEVCVEVVVDHYADADSDGLVTFPLRTSADPPTLACSARLPVS
jgi:hypothetical protein